MSRQLIKSKILLDLTGNGLFVFIEPKKKKGEIIICKKFIIFLQSNIVQYTQNSVKFPVFSEYFNHKTGENILFFVFLFRGTGLIVRSLYQMERICQEKGWTRFVL